MRKRGSARSGPRGVADEEHNKSEEIDRARQWRYGVRVVGRLLLKLGRSRSF